MNFKIKYLLPVFTLFIIGFSIPAQAAVHHTNDTIRSEVFLKMIPMTNDRFDYLGMTTMEARMFRENDYVHYYTKDNRQRGHGKIIRFKNGEMWVHKPQNDTIDKIKIENISTIRKKYTFESFISFITASTGLYLLLTAAVFLIFAIILSSNNNINFFGNSSTLEGLLFFTYAVIVGLTAVSISYNGLKNLLQYRTFRIGRKWKTKLYEIKPVD
ncbi:MAG: hypothetical protein ACI97N_001440 [Cognaticolwellia sp.]|jgi:hypothetical protein